MFGLGVSLISLNFIENRNAVSINTISLSMFHSLCFVSYRFFFLSKNLSDDMHSVPLGFSIKAGSNATRTNANSFLSTGITVDF